MYEYRAEITNIIDGDTVDAKVDLGFDIFVNLRFRLAGIDAPEMTGNSRVLGLASKDYLGILVAGRYLKVCTVKDIRSRDKHDSFGRYLATIIDKDTGDDLNELMVRAGHAKRWGI